MLRVYLSRNQLELGSTRLEVGSLHTGTRRKTHIEKVSKQIT